MWWGMNDKFLVWIVACEFMKMVHFTERGGA